MTVKKMMTDIGEISKYFSKLSASGATGIIRPANSPTLGVKFRFGKTRLQEKPIALQLVDISTYGLNKLKEFKNLKVEVFGQDRRVSFDASILKVSEKALWVNLPVEVVKSERRERQRYKTSDSNTAFFEPCEWNIDPDDITAPPLFSLYKPLSNWCRVIDISFGGICIETRFPAMIARIEENPRFPGSQIILPMKTAFPVSTELKWTKRIRERVKVEDDLFASIQKYKFGLKYIEPSKEFLRSLAEFMKVMQVTRDPEDRPKELANGA